MTKTLTLKPLLNEKTYDLAKSKNVYVFNVPTSTNKHELAKSIKQQFEVDVVSVNTAVFKGKSKRTMSLTGRRALNSYGARANFKKAYVTLKKDQSLAFFESVEEAEEKREATQEKFDKAAQKQAVKSSKAQKPDTGLKRRFLRTKKPEGK
jgi:large subunit ribosomal protein L23